MNHDSSGQTMKCDKCIHNGFCNVKHIPSLCGYKPNEYEALKEQWYLETQHPLSRAKFSGDVFWKIYRRQLELADKLIYYDSSSTTKNEE